MKRTYVRVARVVRKARIAKDISQSELSGELGYKKNQGQFISNVERGLCSLPDKHILKVSEVLNLDANVLISAKIDDFIQSTNESVFSRDEV